MVTKANPAQNAATDEAFEFETEEDAALEIQDDTPEEDRNREPMPEHIVRELENDELDEYSDQVKQRIKQYQKVWHDERREKERALREQNEAVEFARRVRAENDRLRHQMAQGESTLIGTVRYSTEVELNAARAAYKEAYEAGDADRLLAAQERLNNATLRHFQAANYKPTLQQSPNEVELPPQQNVPPAPDARTRAWQERNSWFNADPEMTAAALGRHEALVRQHGKAFSGTDAYWQDIDATMRRRFPEYFGEQQSASPSRRSAAVVAPATRSTSPKKIVLKKSQIAIAKKLGLSPEQYAREVAKLEKDA